MKNYLPVFFDTFFCSFLTFILFRFILSVFIPSQTADIVSIFASLLSALLYFALFKRKADKGFSKKKDGEFYTDTILRLHFLSQTQLLNLFEKAFTKVGRKVKKLNNRLVLEDFNAVAFFYFNFDQITKSKILKYYNLLEKNQVAYIFSTEFPKDVTAFAKKFNCLTLCDGKKTFSILKKAETYPKNDLHGFNKKQNPFDFSVFLDKKRAKTLFFFGIIFMLYSLIVPIKLYYIIVGSIFLIYALILKLFGKDGKTPEIV